MLRAPTTRLVRFVEVFRVISTTDKKGRIDRVRSHTRVSHGEVAVKYLHVTFGDNVIVAALPVAHSSPPANISVNRVVGQRESVEDDFGLFEGTGR